MKVKCFKQDIFDKLTIGKTYDVYAYDNDGDYWIINDNNTPWNYPKKCFKHHKFYQ
jgi:hypothetical protein